MEDVKHFMLQCKAYDSLRNFEMNILKNSLCNAGYESVWNIFISSELHVQLRFVLGSNVRHPMPLFPQESYGITDILFDKYCKSYLQKAWGGKSPIGILNKVGPFQEILKIVTNLFIFDRSCQKTITLLVSYKR